MKNNMGSVDKFIRTMVGIAFLVNIIILEPGAIGTIVLLVLGFIMLGSAWVGYCPLYTPLGICTCSATCTCGTEEPAEKVKTFFIEKNVGNADRLIRALIGLAFIANIFVIMPGIAASMILFILGVAVLASAWQGYCPLYQALGIRTCPESCGK